MDNDDTEYKDGSADDFIEFMFSRPPQGKNTIKLKLDDPTIPIGLHIFQELLMIVTDGMKYLYEKDDSFSINDVTSENIDTLNKYFESMGFHVFIEAYTIKDYLDNMKLPNYFMNKELIEESTLLKDIYYETYTGGFIYRIYFDFCR